MVNAVKRTIEERDVERVQFFRRLDVKEDVVCSAVEHNDSVLLKGLYELSNDKDIHYET
jgi:hypothetical protein